MVTETKQTVAKVKLGGGGGSNQDSSKIKKIESSSKQSADSKNKSASTSVVRSTKKTGRMKKVFSLAGQKYDPPEEREPVRIFYESLSEQIRSSEMAEFWMMEHGLLSPERSKKAHEKKQRKQTREFFSQAATSIIKERRLKIQEKTSR